MSDPDPNSIFIAPAPAAGAPAGSIPEPRGPLAVTLPPPVAAMTSAMTQMAQHRRPPDGALRTLAGLMIVWASLFLVIMSNKLSDTELTLRIPGVDPLHPGPSLARLLEPRNTLLMSLGKLHLQASPRDALLNLAHEVGFTLDPETLSKADVKDKTTSIRIQNIPLYQAIHQLLDDPGKGFALVDRTLLVYPQSLVLKTPVGGSTEGQSLDWKASMRLARQQTLIVPSGASDIWFTITLANNPADASGALDNVQVEVWKGGEWLTMVKGALDEHGSAQLNLTTVGRVTFSIQRIEPATKEQGGLYAMEFYYQSFGA